LWIFCTAWRKVVTSLKFILILTLLTGNEFLHGGPMFGRNPDKSLKSFPPCYSQSTVQLCLEFSISSNSRNLIKFLLYTVKEKGGKPDRKPYPLSYGLRNPYRNLKSGSSQDYAQKPQRKCIHSEFRFGGTLLLLSVLKDITKYRTI
jgi:hypothetical protein